MELEVSMVRDQGVCVLSVAGEVDVYTSPVLRSSLVDAADGECGVVVVDMDKVGFIDSSGLGVLVGALRRMREAGGDLRVVCTVESVVKIFRITGLDKVFPMYSSLDDALGA